MKLIIVRHGQSEANRKGIHQGQIVDSPLSEEGKKQAKIVAEKLKSEDIETIYSSDLKRAFETAKELGKILNLDIIRDKRLREFSWGEFDKNPEKREELFKELYKRESKKGTSKYEIRPPQGENYWDLINRVKSFLEDIKKHDNTVVVYSHGGSIEVALNILEGRDKEKDDFRRYHQENTSINEIVFEEGIWKILEVNNFEHVKLTKPKKQTYENQEEIYNKIKEKIKEKIPEFVLEAYLFGSITKRELGLYKEKFGRHKGSNIDVLIIMNKKDIPLKWKFIKWEKFWTIYERGKMEIEGNKHRIDFYVVGSEEKRLSIEKLNNEGGNLEKIK